MGKGGEVRSQMFDVRCWKLEVGSRADSKGQKAESKEELLMRQKRVRSFPISQYNTLAFYLSQKFHQR